MAILVTASFDGRYEDEPYTLLLVERPRLLERYEVICQQSGDARLIWSETFCYLADAVERFWGELRLYARDKDEADSPH